MKPEAIVFDIGNVLLNWDPDQLYAKLIPDPVARQAFHARTGTFAMNVEIDRGAPFRETVYDLAARHPADAALIRAWHDRWIEMAAPLIDESCAILRALRASGVPVFALSNFGTESFAQAEIAYPVLKEFDRRFISGHMGVIKPDAAIYAALEAETGLEGPALFFTDDSAANIEAAGARGWQTHVFTSSGNLAESLKSLGFVL